MNFKNFVSSLLLVSLIFISLIISTVKSSSLISNDAKYDEGLIAKKLDASKKFENLPFNWLGQKITCRCAACIGRQFGSSEYCLDYDQVISKSVRYKCENKRYIKIGNLGIIEVIKFKFKIEYLSQEGRIELLSPETLSEEGRIKLSPKTNFIKFLDKTEYCRSFKENNNTFENLIFLCVEFDRKDILEFLISNGVTLEDLLATDDKKCNALHKACLLKHVDIAKYLIETFNNLNAENGMNDSIESFVNASDRNGFTPLHFACDCNLKRDKAQVLVALLIKNRARLDSKNNEEETPLHICCKNKFSRVVFEVAECLIESLAPLDVPNCRGDTALHNASLECHSRIVEHLVKFGANVNVKNNEGLTPIECSYMYKCKNVVRILLESGAIINFRSVAKLCFITESVWPLVLYLRDLPASEIRVLVNFINRRRNAVLFINNYLLNLLYRCGCCYAFQ